MLANEICHFASGAIKELHFFSSRIEHFSVRNRETTTYCIIFPPGFFLSFGKVLEDCLNTKTAQKDP